MIKLLMASWFQGSNVIYVRNNLPYDVFDIPRNMNLKVYDE